MGVSYDQLRDRENNCFQLPKPGVMASRYRHSPCSSVRVGSARVAQIYFEMEAVLHEEKHRDDESAGRGGMSVGRLFN